MKSKKLLILAIIFASLMTGCAFNKNKDISIAYDEHNVSGNCHINVTLKKNEQILFNQQETCLDEFELTYSPENDTDFYMRFNKMIKDNIMYTSFITEVKNQLSARNFKTENGDSIEIPMIDVKTKLQKAAIKKNETFLMKNDIFIIELTYQE